MLKPSKTMDVVEIIEFWQQLILFHIVCSKNAQRYNINSNQFKQLYVAL